MGRLIPIKSVKRTTETVDYPVFHQPSASRTTSCWRRVPSSKLLGYYSTVRSADELIIFCAKTIKWRNSEMELKRNGSQPSGKGPVEYFTGMVRIDPLFQAPDPARVLGVSVTFEPGAR